MLFGLLKYSSLTHTKGYSENWSLKGSKNGYFMALLHVKTPIQSIYITCTAYIARA